MSLAESEAVATGRLSKALERGDFSSQFSQGIHMLMKWVGGSLLLWIVGCAKG